MPGRFGFEDPALFGREWFCGRVCRTVVTGEAVVGLVRAGSRYLGRVFSVLVAAGSDSSLGRAPFIASP